MCTLKDVLCSEEGFRVKSTEEETHFALIVNHETSPKISVWCFRGSERDMAHLLRIEDGGSYSDMEAALEAAVDKFPILASLGDVCALPAE